MSLDRELLVEADDLVSRRLAVAQRAEGKESVVVWDAAIVLANTISHNKEFNKEKYTSAIELGAGTGAVGLVAAALGLNVVLTDIDTELIDLNVAKNSLEDRAKVCKLEWANEEDINTAYDLLSQLNSKESLDTNTLAPKSGFDLILISDCIYYRSSVEALVKTIDALSGASTVTLVSYEERESLEKQQCLKLFFNKLIEFGLKSDYLGRHEYHPDYYCDDIHVLRITRM